MIIIVGNRHITKDNHEIRTYRVADRTGSINLCIWDEAGLAVAPSDILRITRRYKLFYFYLIFDLIIFLFLVM